MTNKERIQRILKSGHKALVFDTIDKDYMIIFRETPECFIGSHWRGTIDECLEANDNWHYKGFFNDPHYTVTPYAEKPPVLSVGDPVKILEIAKECGDYDGWEDGKKAMVGMTGKIDAVNDVAGGVGYWVEKDDGTNYHFFPHYTVCLALDEPEELIEIDGKKYKKSEVIERVNKLKAVE